MVRESNKRNRRSNKGRAGRTTRQLHQASTMRLCCAPVSADPPVRPLMHELSAVIRKSQLHGKTSQHQYTHWYTRFIRYIALPSFLYFTCTWFANLINEIGVPKQRSSRSHNSPTTPGEYYATMLCTSVRGPTSPTADA
ncbi:hypothetical protein WA026_007560 [Henosepilachna vigintioctopunctata]|uniref:Uncharacterized protein n=1 Tax=Henosepilachna vigintioctopunctata TaxID=420089 RepID=A0AAW1UUG4_9CUCU